jgi:hypothetical protein
MKNLNLTGAVLIGLGLAIAYGVAKVTIGSYQGAKPVPQMAQAIPQPRPLPANEPSPRHEPKVVVPEASAPPAPERAPERTPKAEQPPQAPQFTQPQPDLTTAREALSYVGLDSDAEEYWYGAINNPSLSANERQNLIEDLNEDGFADPRNPTLDELPLIVNRLLLIEDVAGDAMDQVNADAFQEAYKDLVNMYQALTRQPWGSQ